MSLRVLMMSVMGELILYCLHLPFFIGGRKPVELMQFVAPVTLAFQLVELGLVPQVVPGVLAADQPVFLLLEGRSGMCPKVCEVV